MNLEALKKGPIAWMARHGIAPNLLMLALLLGGLLTSLSIKKEIDKVEQGESDKIDNLLKNAPHTFLEVAANDWTHKYTREQAAFPNEFTRHNKYWAPVGRVDNVYGDRNLVCSCPSMEEYKDEAA